MYGEWMYAKHKIFYDALPHYFIEFDIFDKENGKFLDTPTRQAMLSGSGIVSVPLLYVGAFRSERELLSHLTVSEYISPAHLSVLREEADRLGLDPDTLLSETPNERWAEGLYVKVEEDGAVIERMKYVRHGFTQQKTSDTAWHSRPIVPNRLKYGATIY